MEDAPDFSWDSAKACHAVVLTNMEADRLNWTDTDKIDHIYRTKAYKTQRHTLRAQTSASCLSVKKNKNPQSKKWCHLQIVSGSTLHIIEQLATFIGMSVKLVMGHMQPKIVIKRVGQKTRGPLQ